MQANVTSMACFCKEYISTILARFFGIPITKESVGIFLSLEHLGAPEVVDMDHAAHMVPIIDDDQAGDL